MKTNVLEKEVKNSSQITFLRYGGTELEVTFKGSEGLKDTTYVYFGVPRNIAEGIMGADSAGKYLYANIKGKYRFEKVFDGVDDRVEEDGELLDTEE